MKSTRLVKGPVFPCSARHSEDDAMDGDLPVRSLNSIAIDKIRVMRGSEVVSVRIANVIVSMLLGHGEFVVRSAEAVRLTSKCSGRCSERG